MNPHEASPPSPARARGFRMPPALMRFGAGQLNRFALNPRLPWEVQRRRLGRLMGASPMPRGTTVTESMLNGVRAEVVTASGTRPERTVVHFHGGGYCVGSARMARTWAARLSAQAACRVVLPEYRLAPEHAHPAALDDARDVMSALLSETAAASIVVSGDSAGAGLALSLILAMRDQGEELPAGCILISPWLDLSADRRAVPELVRRDVLLSPRWLEACAAAYAGRNLAEPSVSPLFATHGGLPALLIQAASDDLLVPDAERLAASASAAGVDVTFTKWPRMWHDFALQPGILAAADSALSQAAWFLETVTGS
ncbi:MAG TPA: alpha/beta hydrolase [Streptosporangiaceae bacterium]|nr:alpha/beta hydrolase [Streptosporangiaceae bacterium]